MCGLTFYPIFFSKNWLKRVQHDCVIQNRFSFHFQLVDDTTNNKETFHREWNALNVSKSQQRRYLEKAGIFLCFYLIANLINYCKYCVYMCMGQSSEYLPQLGPDIHICGH